VQVSVPGDEGPSVSEIPHPGEAPHVGAPVTEGVAEGEEAPPAGASIKEGLAEGEEAPPAGASIKEGLAEGDGPIDAMFKAINAATGIEAVLSEFHVEAVTEGQDALGQVSVVVVLGSFTGAGQGVSTDTVHAAGEAYVRALSVARARAEAGERPLGVPAAAGE
jgi:hypothetical protein